MIVLVTSRCHITVFWEAADMSPMIMQVGRASVIGMWGPERKEQRACPEEGEQWVVGLDIVGRE